MITMLLSALSGRAALIVGAVALLIATAGGAGWTGYHLRGQSCDRDAETQRANQATAFATAERLAAERYRTATETAARADVALADTRQTVAATASAVKTRIVYVTTQYIPSGASAPVDLPRCVFTRGWLRDYNTALGVPGTAQSAAAGGTGNEALPAAAVEAGLLADSGLTQADILAHAADYGAWCGGLSAQVTGLIGVCAGD